MLLDKLKDLAIASGEYAYWDMVESVITNPSFIALDETRKDFQNVQSDARAEEEPFWSAISRAPRHNEKVSWGQFRPSRARMAWLNKCCLPCFSCWRAPSFGLLIRLTTSCFEPYLRRTL